MAMSTLKSSAYRTWSTRPYQHEIEDNNPAARQHNRSYDTVRSHGASHDTVRSPGISHDTMRSHGVSHDTMRSHGTISHDLKLQAKQLRLQLTTNSQGYIQLDLSNRSLLSIPMEVFLFSRLEVLKLPRNKFQEIPLAISRLRSLKFLHLEENNLKFLPETLSNCINLLELNLTKNNLTALPSNIGMLKNLRILRLGQNDFECIPHELGQLENLRYLDVQSNHLWYLPFSIAKLHKLKYFNLSNNKFEHLPLPVCKITSLKTLTLRGNNLMNLLPDFDSLSQLQELNLAYNRFELIPQSIFRLKTLQYLNFNGNMLEMIPAALTNIKTLKVLHVQANKIESIPEMFCNLQYLNISHNKLYNFSIVNMKKLKSLNGNNNYLENIPMGLYSMTRIECVRLNNNQIRYISSDIANCKKLRTLDLGNNMLVHIPQVLHQLERLDYFNIRGNKIADKISLYNGDIISPNDYHKKRRMFQAKKPSTDTKNRHSTYKSTGKRSRQRSRSHNTTFRSRSLSPAHTLQQHSYPQMWDSADLLQNGFSTRHLESNSQSAFLNKLPMDTEITQPFGDTSFTNTSIKSYSRIPAHEAALLTDSDDVSMVTVPVKTIDYQLLGVCNQLEMLLNKQLLHPVLSFKGHKMGKSFSEKSIVKTASGLWRMSGDKNENITRGLVITTTETFTVTPQGGWLSSSHDSNISIFLPPKAVSTLIQTQMKILKIRSERMLELRQKNRIVSNIIAIGPIVYLKNLNGGEFNHQVTITIPAPKCEISGHQHVLTIKEDNSCTPSSSGCQHKNGYCVLKAWNLAGKVAVVTRAKCKYKACKSMEQLLYELSGLPVSNEG